MAGRRLARLNEQLKREISDILRTEVRDPRIGLPTVTDVEVTPDLWLARVYVRPDPTQEEKGTDELLEGLEHASPFIRRQLADTLAVRRIPELRFLADETLEKAMRIERILHEVLPDDQGGGEEDGTEEPGSEPGASPDVRSGSTDAAPDGTDGG